MKKRFLVTVAFMLVIVCGMLMTRAVMAEDCWTLAIKRCTTGPLVRPCGSTCGPFCYKIIWAPYYVDRCQCVASGFHDCVDDNEMVNCMLIYTCGTTSTTCPTDPNEKKCGRVDEFMTWDDNRKALTGSGCGN